MPVQTAKLDAKGRKLIALLAQYGKMTATALGKQVRLSKEAVSYRIQKFKEEKILQCFVPIIDLRTLGYRVFELFLMVNERQKQKEHELLQWMCNHPRTRSVIEYSDTWDYGWIVIVKDIWEFDLLEAELTEKFSDIIIELDKCATITGYTSHTLPYSFEKINWKPEGLRSPDSAEIDDKDLKVLVELCKNSRASSYEISKAVGFSSDSVLKRTKKLEKQGVIRAYTALYNLASLGYQWYTYTLSFSRFSKKDEIKFREFIANHKNVIRAIRTFGKWDALIEIAASNPSEYHNTVKEIKNTFADILRKYECWLVYREHAYKTLPQIISR